MPLHWACYVVLFFIGSFLSDEVALGFAPPAMAGLV
jgi:hypothetical protein